MRTYKQNDDSKYVEHICSEDKKFEGRVYIDSYDKGVTFGFDEEYRHEILFCLYCGVQIAPDYRKWLREQRK